MLMHNPHFPLIEECPENGHPNPLWSSHPKPPPPESPERPLT